MTPEQLKYFAPRPKEEMVIVQEERDNSAGWKVAIGAGVIGFLGWLIFRSKGKGEGGSESGGVPADPNPLLFRVLDDGLRLGLTTMSLDAAIKRVKDGSRADVRLIFPGSTKQGHVDAAKQGFSDAGISILGA